VSEQIVESGKVVSLIYRLHDQNDELFEYRDLPVAYLHGTGSDLFPKIEQALEGHVVGDRIAVSLAPEEGFGDHDPNLTFTDDVENVPPEVRRIGAEVVAENEKGEQRVFYVTKIADGKLTVDCNHPLAGQTVRFQVSITDIRDATEAELKDGKPQDDAAGGPLSSIQ